MTKKHYEAIAQALRSSKPQEPETNRINGYTLSEMEKIQAFKQWQKDAAEITVAIRGFNPLFDQIKFEIACGLIVAGGPR